MLFVIGCGKPQVSYAPVSGIVTVDGNPIAGAQVVLSCDDVQVDGAKPTSRALTDDEGRFVLRSLTPDKRMVDGAVVGHHRVTVITRIAEADEGGALRVVRPEMLDRRYPEGVALTLDVPPEGIEALRFDLTSK